MLLLTIYNLQNSINTYATCNALTCKSLLYRVIRTFHPLVIGYIYEDYKLNPEVHPQCMHLARFLSSFYSLGCFPILLHVGGKTPEIISYSYYWQNH